MSDKKISAQKNRSFFKDYETFRKFLKVNFDFCSLSSDKIGDYLEKFGKTKYNEYKNKAETIGMNKIIFPKINGKKTFKYDVNQFESDYNFLANSFQLKTLTAYEANIIIYLLVLLANKSMTANEILEVLILEDRKALDNHLKNMVQYGLLTKQGQQYTLSENLYMEMNEDELLKFVNYVDFMKNIICPQALGYFFFNTVKRIYEKKTGRHYYSPFQFKYSHLANILDDDVLWTIIESIQNKKRISCTYNKDELIITPVKIFTENEYNRIYLFGVNKYDRIRILRISKIYNVKILENEPAVTESKFAELNERYAETKKYSFSGKLDSVNKHQIVRIKFNNSKMKKQIQRDFGTVRFVDRNIAEVTIMKKNLIIPWLRSNLGQVEVLDDEIAMIIENDIAEMKKIYGIIS